MKENNLGLQGFSPPPVRAYLLPTERDYLDLLAKLAKEDIKLVGTNTGWVFGRYTCVVIHKTFAQCCNKDVFANIFPKVPIEQYSSLSGGSDTGGTVFVPDYVADWIATNKKKEKSLKNIISRFGYYDSAIEHNISLEHNSAIVWSLENPYLFARAYEEGYRAAVNKLYVVSINSKILVKTGKLKEPSKLYMWRPRAYRLTEAEIKEIDPRFWKSAIPAENFFGRDW